LLSGITLSVSVGTLNAEALITENRDYWNMAEVLAQIGLIPP
jgi:hypothetical protein